MGTAAKPTRENHTITIDFQNETTYFQLHRAFQRAALQQEPSYRVKGGPY
ncbi:MAG TPA: hypothetical protein VLQ80_10080 [Candidatus Saccharimonadia bacterium]|nr:hypothetical protein [Candidatus Saccharimonadia bacterium]